MARLIIIVGAIFGVGLFFYTNISEAESLPGKETDIIRQAWSSSLATRTSHKYIPFSGQLRASCTNDGVVVATDTEFRLLDPATGQIKSKFPFSYELEAWANTNNSIVYSLRDWDGKRSIFGAIQVGNGLEPFWQFDFDIKKAASLAVHVHINNEVAIWSPIEPFAPLSTVLVDIKTGKLISTFEHHGAPIVDFRYTPAFTGRYLVMPVSNKEQDRFEVVDLDRPEKLSIWRPDVLARLSIDQVPFVEPIGKSRVVVGFSKKDRNNRRKAPTSYLFGLDLTAQKPPWDLDLSSVSDTSLGPPVLVKLDDKRLVVIVNDWKGLIVVDSATGKLLGQSSLSGYQLLQRQQFGSVKGRLLAGVRKILDKSQTAPHGIASIDPMSGQVDWFYPTGESSKPGSFTNDIPTHIEACFGRVYVSMGYTRAFALEGKAVDTLLEQ